MKILITSGATQEPIDGVRYLTNLSTGKTGACLADTLARAGHSITYLAGQSALLPSIPCEVVRFRDFQSLDSLLRTHLGERLFDAVIQVAAVSDYSVSTVRMDGRELESAELAGKIGSESQELEITLKRNFKIVERLRSYSQAGQATQVVAFKLTNTSDRAARLQAVTKLLTSSAVDLVVHNDLSEMTAGRHPFTLHCKDGKNSSCLGAENLGALLVTHLTQRSEK